MRVCRVCRISRRPWSMLVFWRNTVDFLVTKKHLLLWVLSRPVDSPDVLSSRLPSFQFWNDCLCQCSGLSLGYSHLVTQKDKSVNHLFHGKIRTRKISILKTEATVVFIFASIRICAKVFSFLHRHPATLTNLSFWLHLCFISFSELMQFSNLYIPKLIVY